MNLLHIHPDLIILKMLLNSLTMNFPTEYLSYIKKKKSKLPVTFPFDITMKKNPALIDQ